MSCTCLSDDWCGECEYGYHVLSGEAVFIWKDSRSQLCHDGSYLCGACQNLPGVVWPRFMSNCPGLYVPQHTFNLANFQLEMQ